MSTAIPVEELRRRYMAVYGAGPIYDVLERRGLPHQVLSHNIRPLVPHMKTAGPAYTVKGVRRPPGRWEGEREVDLLGGVRPGCVIVYDPGSEQESGHWGELTSNAAAARGAQGVVVDGGARDAAMHLEIPNWSCFCRYTSPIEAGRRQSIVAVNVPILVSGSLTTTVEVKPNDFIFAGLCGIIVIPQEIAADVLVEVEEIVEKEKKGRQELRSGTPLGEIGKKYGVG
jgi:regulator of RNase E activity RraA